MRGSDTCLSTRLINSEVNVFLSPSPRSWMSCGGTTSPNSSSSWTPFSSYCERIITRSPFSTSTTTPACWTSGGLSWTGCPAATVSVWARLRPPVTHIFPVTTFTVCPESKLNNSSPPAPTFKPLALKTARFLHKVTLTDLNTSAPCPITLLHFCIKLVQKTATTVWFLTSPKTTKLWMLDLTCWMQHFSSGLIINYFSDIHYITFTANGFLLISLELWGSRLRQVRLMKRYCYSLYDGCSPVTRCINNLSLSPQRTSVPPWTALSTSWCTLTTASQPSQPCGRTSGGRGTSRSFSWWVIIQTIKLYRNASFSTTSTNLALKSS